MTSSKLNINVIGSGDTFNYVYAPAFASGRVVVDSMLDCILLQMLNNPSILEIFNLLCGSKTKKDIENDELLGIKASYLRQISVPTRFHGLTYIELFSELLTKNGIITIGLCRDSNHEDGNKLPFVYTNPISQLVLMGSDKIFILK
jgi:hypothetical protein